MELLELILEDDNLHQAVKKVVQNKGSGGIDKKSVIEGREYFYKHIEEIKSALRKRLYKLSPIRRVEIPKPDGGKRKLGIPIVVDRIIQQAISQVLTPIYDIQFSDSSYGFRPNGKKKIKSMHMEKLENSTEKTQSNENTQETIPVENTR